MKYQEITNKTQADLEKMIAEKREALRVFRFGGAGAKTKNVKEGKGMKKDIARILSAMNVLKNKAVTGQK